MFWIKALKQQKCIRGENKCYIFIIYRCISTVVNKACTKVGGFGSYIDQSESRRLLHRI